MQIRGNASAKGADTDVPLCPNVSVPTGSQDCKHLSSLPVISRPFNRNFNNKQFSPTSEANLQVCCNFTKWEHSGSTENPGPAGSGLRSKEWVCREESAQQMQREKERQEKTGYWVPGSSPSRDKAAANVPWYVFNNSTSHHFLSLACVLATCNTRLLAKTLSVQT